jgi:DnaK suppressor protein
MEKQIDLVMLKNRLKKQQKVLSTRIKVEKERASPNSLANPDRADLAYDYAYRDRRLSMLDKLEEQLDETREALERIENGTYGQCTNCGEFILPERLEALPTATLCINCQRKVNIS